MTRLIDADAPEKELNNERERFVALDMKGAEHILVHSALRLLREAPTIDAVPVETVCEMFGNEAPCNYGLFGVSVDDFMMSKCGKWCEDNCDKVPHTECWRKFFEAIEEWRKQND